MLGNLTGTPIKCFSAMHGAAVSLAFEQARIANSGFSVMSEGARHAMHMCLS